MKVYNQIQENDCSLSILKTFYYYYYQKDIQNKYLEKYEDNLITEGMSIEDLEIIARKHFLIVHTYSLSLTKYSKLQIRTPHVIMVKTNGLNHYGIVKYKNSKGITINDLNNHEKFFLWKQINWTGVVLEIIPKLKIIEKGIIRAKGIFKNIDFTLIYHKNIKLVLLIILLITLYIFLSVSSSFYAYFLFSSDLIPKTTEALVIIGIFILLFSAKVVFEYIYLNLINIFKLEIDKHAKKTFFYHSFYKKWIKKQKINKNNYLSTKNDYEKVSNYFSTFIFEWTFIILSLILFISALLIIHLYILILIYFTISIIYLFVTSLLSTKINVDISNFYNTDRKIINENLSIANQKVNKSEIYKIIMIMNDNENKIQKKLLILNKTSLLMRILKISFSSILFFSTVTYLFWINSENIGSIIVLILLLSFFVQSIDRFFRVWIEKKNIEGIIKFYNE